MGRGGTHPYPNKIMSDKIWNTETPPLDGAPIVAIGRVIFEDEFSTTVEPFLAAIRWLPPPTGRIEGWHHVTGAEMSLRPTMTDEIKIDYWIQYPQP
jgi:hypothetical protein